MGEKSVSISQLHLCATKLTFNLDHEKIPNPQVDWSSMKVAWGLCVQRKRKKGRGRAFQKRSLQQTARDFGRKQLTKMTAQSYITTGRNQGRPLTSMKTENLSLPKSTAFPNSGSESSVVWEGEWRLVLKTFFFSFFLTSNVFLYYRRHMSFKGLPYCGFFLIKRLSLVCPKVLALGLYWEEGQRLLYKILIFFLNLTERIMVWMSLGGIECIGSNFDNLGLLTWWEHKFSLNLCICMNLRK